VVQQPATVADEVMLYAGTRDPFAVFITVAHRE
jgi:hypothetical protein